MEDPERNMASGSRGKKGLRGPCVHSKMGFWLIASRTGGRANVKVQSEKYVVTFMGYGGACPDYTVGDARFVFR